MATRSEFRTLFLKKKQTNDVVLAWRRPKWLRCTFCYVHQSLSLTLTKHKPPNPLISVLAAGHRASGDWILEIATVRRIARSYFFAAPPLVAATRRRPHRLWWFSSPHHHLFWSLKLCFFWYLSQFLVFYFVNERGVVLLCYLIYCSFSNEGGDYVVHWNWYTELYCSVIWYTFFLRSWYNDSLIILCIVVLLKYCLLTCVINFDGSTVILDVRYFIMLMFLSLEYGWTSLRLLLCTLFVIWNVRHFEFEEWIDQSNYVI